MKTIGKVILNTFLLVFVLGLTFALAEDLTITTYYPSPYGSYRELTWGDFPNSKGKLSADNGASIQLGGSGTPYISFSNDMTATQDYYLKLNGNDDFWFQGGMGTFATDAGLPASIRVREVIYCSGGW